MSGGGENEADREAEMHWSADEAFGILSNKVRRDVLKILMDGKPRTAPELAEMVGREFDGVSKHMRVMRAAGIVDAFYDPRDYRVLFFEIPERLRQVPGVLDLGCCVVRFAEFRKVAKRGGQRPAMVKSVAEEPERVVPTPRDPPERPVRGLGRLSVFVRTCLGRVRERLP